MTLIWSIFFTFVWSLYHHQNQTLVLTMLRSPTLILFLHSNLSSAIFSGRLYFISNCIASIQKGLLTSIVESAILIGRSMVLTLPHPSLHIWVVVISHVWVVSPQMFESHWHTCRSLIGSKPLSWVTKKITLLPFLHRNTFNSPWNRLVLIFYDKALYRDCLTTRMGDEY